MTISKRHRSKIGKGLRHAVYVRDDWTCQDCDRSFAPSERGLAPHEVDRTTKSPLFYNDVWLEIDHIHPLRHGGTGDITNLRAVCTICNRRKSYNIPEAVS